MKHIVRYFDSVNYDVRCGNVCAMPGPPKPALNIFVPKVTSDSVVLSWQHTGSSFESVLVRYRAIDSETTAMCEQSYERPRDNRVTVSGLNRFIDYEFHVVFVNGAGCSQASGPQYASTARPGNASYSSEVK